PGPQQNNWDRAVRRRGRARRRAQRDRQVYGGHPTWATRSANRRVGQFVGSLERGWEIPTEWGSGAGNRKEIQRGCGDCWHSAVERVATEGQRECGSRALAEFSACAGSPGWTPGRQNRQYRARGLRVERFQRALDKSG